MSSITMQLDHYRASLAEALARGEEAMARKIEQQISELEAFRVRHPDIPKRLRPSRSSAISTLPTSTAASTTTEGVYDAEGPKKSRIRPGPTRR